MKTLNLDSIKEIRDLARKKDRNYFNFVDELEKILKTKKRKMVKKTSRCK